MLKDRVVIAIYMAEMLLVNNKKPKEEISPTTNVMDDFKLLLGSRTDLVDEFESFTPEKQKDQADVEIKVKIINSLDVNLMLVFLWLACLTSDLPVLEKDILKCTQNDSFGYLSEY